MELQKHLEDVSAALEEIEDGVKDRQDELDSALDKADNFDRTFQVNFLTKNDKRQVLHIFQTFFIILDLKKVYLWLCFEHEKFRFSEPIRYDVIISVYRIKLRKNKR